MDFIWGVLLCFRACRFLHPHNSTSTPQWSWMMALQSSLLHPPPPHSWRSHTLHFHNRPLQVSGRYRDVR
jgi:hypothetical protein